MGLPAKLAITNSNYCEYGNSIENLVTLRISEDIPLGKGGTLSMDVGGRHNTGRNSHTGKYTTSFDGFFEAKYKQKFTDNLRGYVRYRNYDKTEQLRLAFGGSVPLNDEWGVYADAHWTHKTDMNYNPDNGKKPINTAGFWIGAEYSPKSVPGLSVWVEPFQINVKTQKVLGEDEKRCAYCGNIGVTWTIGKSKQ